MTGATSEAGTAYPSDARKFISVLVGFIYYLIFVFCVVYYCLCILVSWRTSSTYIYYVIYFFIRYSGWFNLAIHSIWTYSFPIKYAYFTTAWYIWCKCELHWLHCQHSTTYGRDTCDDNSSKRRIPSICQ